MKRNGRKKLEEKWQGRANEEGKTFEKMKGKGIQNGRGKGEGMGNK